jgi:transcription initiation factor IIE alpha subunit
MYAMHINDHVGLVAVLGGHGAVLTDDEMSSITGLHQNRRFLWNPSNVP